MTTATLTSTTDGQFYELVDLLERGGDGATINRLTREMAARTGFSVRTILDAAEAESAVQ